jgi:hypothetical protein
MKQRTRIRRIKARTYPDYIYLARVRRAWAKARQVGRSLSEAMREVYAKAMEESK